jgi:hypothetical protein
LVDILWGLPGFYKIYRIFREKSRHETLYPLV